MKKVLDFLPLISICFVYVGFCNLYYYYKEFSIDIYSYITSTDILLSFLPRIVVLSSFIYGYLLQSVFHAIEQPKATPVSESEVNKKAKRIAWWRKYIVIVVFTYLIATTVFLIIMQTVFKYKTYELTDWSLLFDMLFVALLYIAYLIHGKGTELIESSTIIALFLMLFIGRTIGNYRRDDARRLKDGIHETKEAVYNFEYKGANIQTSDSLFYIGQTSTHLFLYNKKDSVSHIYKIADIEDLTIKQ